MRWLEVALAILVCYRVSRLISLDIGPYRIFERIRLYCGKRAKDSPLWFNMAEGVNCPYCVGVWIAFFLAIFLCKNVLTFFLLWFGIAGGQDFLQAIIGDSD